MYGRRVDPSGLAFRLSTHRHSHTSSVSLSLYHFIIIIIKRSRRSNTNPLGLIICILGLTLLTNCICLYTSLNKHMNLYWELSTPRTSEKRRTITSLSGGDNDTGQLTPLHGEDTGPKSSNKTYIRKEQEHQPAVTVDTDSANNKDQGTSLLYMEKILDHVVQTTRT